METIKIETQALNALLDKLSYLPYREVAGLITAAHASVDKVNKEVQAQ